MKENREGGRKAKSIRDEEEKEVGEEEGKL